MALEMLSPDVMTILVEEPILRTQCVLGEGPIWDPRTQTLHFIDILKPRLYHYHPESGKLDIEEVEESIGCLALRKSDGLACAAKRGFGLLDEPGKIKYLSKPLPEPNGKYARFNDGACDPNGIFWAGTLEYKTDEGESFPGQLWRFDPSTNEATMIDDNGITDSNAIGWSADHKTMYYVNSMVDLIHEYDYDLASGMATNRRNYVDGEAMGLKQAVYGKPDGFCIDKEGCMWSARWEGSRIVRFTPDGKSVDLEIHIPKAYNVTACCFGGPNMDRLFITTASPYANLNYPEHVNAERLKQYPDSGDVFMVDFANLPEGIVESHKGVKLGPSVGDFEWRHMFPY